MFRRTFPAPLLWALLWTVHGLLGEALAIATAFDTGLYLGFSTLTDIPTLLFILTWVTAVIVLLARRRWLPAALTLLAVACGSIASLSPWSTVDLAAHWRLWRERPAIDRRIEASTTSPGYRRLEWDWGETGLAVTAAISSTLVYDETDQLPREVESGAARGDPYDTTFPPDASFCRSLGGHFYLVSTIEQ